jgi:Family of unknown function (DUF6551)
MDEFSGTFELVDPHVILVDHLYQRGEKSTLIDAIASNPRWEMFGVVTCFVREREVNGKTQRAFYAVDGQQRIRGVLKSENPPKAVPVVWYQLTNVSDEAAVFVRINEYRKALSALEKHKGKIVAKDPAATAIERAVELAGFTIGAENTRGESARTIHAIASLNWIYNLIGEEGVTQTLTQVREAWPDDKAGVESMMLKAIAQVIAEQQGSSKNGGYNRGALTRKLQQTTPSALFRKAEGLRFDMGGSRALNLRRALKQLAKV